MLFRTLVEIEKAEAGISYNDYMMMFGSCFVENIGKKLQDLKFPIDVNPFGVLYNPESIRRSIVRMLERRLFDEWEIFEQEGVWNSFYHHTKFAKLSSEEFLNQANCALLKGADRLEKCSVLFLTLGTAWIYRLKSSGEVVSNCHKLPAAMFVRERLEVDEIVESYSGLISTLLSKNPQLRIIFTVSPIRHWKDGAHENQISKATLLLAVEKLKSLFPKTIEYFPAYEIVMDELRDYRFYAEDMIHPNEQAVQYIWERFSETYFSEETMRTINAVSKLTSALQHRPFNPESESYKKFLSTTYSQMKSFCEKNPNIDFSEELKMFER
jgi:hypothetical protein